MRDPYGLKPLCIGKRDNAWVLASESCALTSIGAEFVRDVAPGEIVTFDKTGNLKSEFMPVDVKKAHCIFEYIYFARLDSKIDNISVYEARIRGGATLAKTYPVDADLVCGVPDSGLASAKGYSEESGIPFGLAFHKNSYVGRTFIKPTQKERESSVKIKLSVLESVVKGKRIVLVDDSIVRGTTISNLITMLRKAGATEVHVRISSPPFLYPCYFGTDVPSNKQLIASSHSTEESASRSERTPWATCRSKAPEHVGDCRSVVHASTVIIRWKYQSRISALFWKADFVFFPLTAQILHP